MKRRRGFSKWRHALRRAFTEIQLASCRRNTATGQGNSQNVLRALASISLFKEKVRIENSNEHPVDPFNDALERHAQLLRGGRDTLHVLPAELEATENIDDIVESTGRHFGALFSNF